MNRIPGNVQEHHPLPPMDPLELANDLKASIEGEVRFDDGSRALYATDGSNYRQVPIGVVIPKTMEDVVNTIALCRRHGAPLLSRGGGTSLTGGCCNVAVVMDMSKHLNQVLEIDSDRKFARVQPGTVLDTLRNQAEKHHLTFAPDPSTHDHCTLGGMLGNNSCGVHSVMGGRTVDNVHELDVVTYDGTRMTVGKTSPSELERWTREPGRRGEIYRRLQALRERYSAFIREQYPRIPRRVSGYSLDELLPENGFHIARALVGSESTCVTILEAKLRLVYSPPARSLLVLGYPDIYTAADNVMEVMEAGPVGLEGIDDRLISDMKKKGLHADDLSLMPKGAGWLLAEFGGETKRESDAKAQRLMERLKRSAGAPDMRLYDDKKQEKKLWEVRESGLGATAFLPGSPDTWEGWEDSAVPPEKLGGYLRDLRKLFDQYGYACSLYGHFGQGCVHTRIDFDLVTAEGIRTYRSFMEDAARLVVSYGGSLSGEHGDGQSRAELLPLMYGPELIQAFREFKSIWDPEGKMNPGKKVDAYPIDSNLRLGTSYNPPIVSTHFQYPDDKHSFARAALRCVGVGKCRRDEGGTMCPSYQATKEEMHSTRGRSRLLFEMLQGEALHHGWREKAVHEALDLCLACKGCKSDCPVNVDMATYKAEFYAHYYKGRLRPRHAYAMGLIHRWANLASKIPKLANFVGQSKLLSPVLKAAGGIAQERKLPPFAEETFKDWWKNRKRTPRHGLHPQVLLWPDTFNNYFRPQIARAAVEVLEAAGFEVLVPSAALCCGRPLYDFGMLDRAKHQLQQILETLAPQIREGIPLVGLEPSCVAVFRDELGNLFPGLLDAQRLKAQTFELSEFLDKRVPGYRPPPLHRKALLHVHCHHKAVIGESSLLSLLDKLGLDYEIPDKGCCGMAGSFGFEKKHYEISQQIGSRKLIPAVKAAGEDTLIVASGFSCSEQIGQSTARHALHLAEVLKMAYDEAGRQEQPGEGWRGLVSPHGPRCQRKNDPSIFRLEPMGFHEEGEDHEQSLEA